MNQNQKLNNLVLKYQVTKLDAVFTEIHSAVNAHGKELRQIANSLRADIHEVTAVYDDVLMKCVARFDGKSDFINFYNSSVVRKRTDLYRKKKRQSEKEVFESSFVSDDGEQLADSSFVITDGITTEDIALAKKKTDQRQLIGSLLSGADESTTAIVETFLHHPKPTPTAIGKDLGIHHSVVIRKLERLAGKFDSKQYGEHRDYLVAL